MDSLSRSPFTTPVERNVAELIDERLESWNTTLKSLIEFFNGVVLCDNYVSSSYSKGAASLADAVPATPIVEGDVSMSEDPSSPSIKTNAWLAPIQAYALTMVSGMNSLVRFVKEETLIKLDQTKTDFKARAKDIRDRLMTAQKSLMKIQDNLFRGMNEHGKVWMLLLAMKGKRTLSHQGGQSPSTPIDPTNEEIAGLPERDAWLSELQLLRNIFDFVDEKERYCMSLTQIYNDLRTLEHDLTERSVAILSEYFTLRAKHNLVFGNESKETNERLGAIRPSSTWSMAIKQARLDYEWNLEAPPIDGFVHSVFNQISCDILGGLSQPANSPSGVKIRSATGSVIVSPSGGNGSKPIATISMIRSLRIVKTGFAQRPGTFRSWNTVFLVLTDGGWIHGYIPSSSLFQSKNTSKLVGKRRNNESSEGESRTGLDTGLESKIDDPSQSAESIDEMNSLEIPTAGTKYSIRNLQEMNNAFANALHLKNSLEEPSPILHSSHNTVAFINDNLISPAFSFPLLVPNTTVVVESPNEYSFGIISPGTSGFFGRAERKLHLKSFAQEDMVDWCISIKEQIHIVTSTQFLSSISPAQLASGHQGNPMPMDTRSRKRTSILGHRQDTKHGEMMASPIEQEYPTSPWNNNDDMDKDVARGYGTAGVDRYWNGEDMDNQQDYDFPTPFENSSSFHDIATMSSPHAQSEKLTNPPKPITLSQKAHPNQAKDCKEDSKPSLDSTSSTSSGKSTSSKPTKPINMDNPWGD